MEYFGKTYKKEQIDIKKKKMRAHFRGLLEGARGVSTFYECLQVLVSSSSNELLSTTIMLSFTRRLQRSLMKLAVISLDFYKSSGMICN